MNSVNTEEEKKTTIQLSSEIARELVLQAAETGKSQKWIVGQALKAFLTTRISFNDAIKKTVFNFRLSDDPEDRLEVPITVLNLKTLHASIHEALRAAGVNPDECK